MILRSTLLFMALFILPRFALATNIEVLLQQEVNGYIQQLESSQGNELAQVGNRIESSGLSDERLFSVVNRILQDKHQQQMLDSTKDKVLIHQVVTLLRTLASSGDYQYLSSIRKILGESDNRAIRNRAKHVTKKVNFYASRNGIMQNMESHKESQSLHSTRLLNLLNHHDLIMRRFAAEVIVRQGSAEESVQQLIANRVKENIHKEDSKLQIDTLAWYCKVLGTVNKDKYFDLLTKISKDKSISSKIRRHTKKVLKS